MTNQESLSKAAKKLMLEEPFYGLFLITMNKVWRTSLDTAGVSKNGINTQLAINPVFWSHLSPEYKIGILKHELLHVAFQHLIMRDRYKHHRLFNIAADLEINQYIKREYLPGGSYTSKEEYEKDTKIVLDIIQERLEAGEITKEEAREEALQIPMRALFLEDFHELKLEPKKGTDYYYKKLEEAMDEDGGSSQCEALNEALKNSHPDSTHNGDPNGIPREAPWQHTSWKEFEDLSEADKKLIQKQIDYQMKELASQVQKSRGIIPGELKQYIDSLNYEEPPKFDWRGYLRRFAGGSIKTFTKKTRRKPSKRFYGAPGLRIKQKKHILVGIDTSGSVSDEELAEIFQEIHHMHKTGAEVTVIQCDTAISNIAKYKKPEDGKVKVYGRGGTSFQPVVDYFNDNQRDFSCLIYLTDGEAPAPDPVPRGRCLWVLTSRSRETDHLPGSTIKLEN